MSIPAAIIIVNNDLTSSVQAKLVNQLFIDEVIDGYTFDSRVLADPSYHSTVVAHNLRIMVVRPFTELDNRDVADIVIFIKLALAYIMQNKFGPPGQTYPVLNINWGQLGIY